MAEYHECPICQSEMDWRPVLVTDPLPATHSAEYTCSNEYCNSGPYSLDECRAMRWACENCGWKGLRSDIVEENADLTCPDCEAYDVGVILQTYDKTHVLRQLSKIVDEFERATAKFPAWPTDPLHALAVLGEEFGELTKEMLQLTYEPHKSSAEAVQKEAIQTAAMALRLVLSLDRYQYQPGSQHQQGGDAP